MYSSASNARDLLKASIDAGKSKYEVTTKVTLPPLISEVDDIWAFAWPQTVPNFITHLRVTARIAFADQLDLLSDTIVFIPNADPGFDWLFGYPIKGLVTAWGGVNSHMAIRAGELGLPAVIGCGQLLYDQWSNAEVLTIDCANNAVKVIS